MIRFALLLFAMIGLAVPAAAVAPVSPAHAACAGMDCDKACPASDCVVTGQHCCALLCENPLVMACAALRRTVVLSSHIGLGHSVTTPPEPPPPRVGPEVHI